MIHLLFVIMVMTSLRLSGQCEKANVSYLPAYTYMPYGFTYGSQGNILNIGTATGYDTAHSVISRSGDTLWSINGGLNIAAAGNRVLQSRPGSLFFKEGSSSTRYPASSLTPVAIPMEDRFLVADTVWSLVGSDGIDTILFDSVAPRAYGLHAAGNHVVTWRNQQAHLVWFDPAGGVASNLHSVILPGRKIHHCHVASNGQWYVLSDSSVRVQNRDGFLMTVGTHVKLHVFQGDSLIKVRNIESCDLLMHPAAQFAIMRSDKGYLEIILMFRVYSEVWGNAMAVWSEKEPLLREISPGGHSLMPLQWVGDTLVYRLDAAPRPSSSFIMSLVIHEGPAFIGVPTGVADNPYLPTRHLLGKYYGDLLGRKYNKRPKKSGFFYRVDLLRRGGVETRKFFQIR